MDEASQVDLITGVLALSVAKNAVIVGDLKQLPNVITTENKKLLQHRTSICTNKNKLNKKEEDTCYGNQLSKVCRNGSTEYKRSRY
jgi:superfamily I DNA and/or RNA helicase